MVTGPALGQLVAIVYVAMQENGSQRTYMPKEFAEKFGWRDLRGNFKRELLWYGWQLFRLLIL